MTAEARAAFTEALVRYAGHVAATIRSLCGWASAFLLAALLALVLASVAARYLGGTAIEGADEAAIWLHLALVFAAMPVASQSTLAMRLDLFTERNGPRTSAVLDVVSGASVTHAALVLSFGAASAAATVGGVSPMLDVPEGWRFAAPVAGAGLTVLYAFACGIAEGRAGSAGVALLLGILLYAATGLATLPAVPLPSLVALAAGLLLILAGAPVPHALISGAAFAAPFGGLLPEAALAQTTVASLQRFLLLAIPFFLLAGGAMMAGGLAERLVELARSLTRGWRGGMAQTVLGTNLLLSGVTGSSIADAAFGAKVLAPGLVRDGTSPERAAAIVAATSILPNIAPPSIAFLILATATDLSVGALFAGGLAAALLLYAAMAALLAFSARRDAPPPSWTLGRRQAFRRALPVLGLALVILFGLRLGIVTTTEAAALAAAYAVVACAMARWADGPRILAVTFREAAIEASAVGLLVASAAPLVFLLAVDGLPDLVAGLFAAIDDPLAMLLLANLVLLVAGTLLDIGAGILLLAPLLTPAAVAAGIDPIHFGVILVVNLMIGGLTPPVGVLVFVAARIGGVAPAQVFRAVLPLMGAQLAALGLLTLYAALFAR